MASDKQRRKAARAKKPRPAGPFRHPDGDRRHRGGPTAKQAIRDKKLLDMIGAVELPEEDESEQELTSSPPPAPGSPRPC